jgi:hypothetical protein
MRRVAIRRHQSPCVTRLQLPLTPPLSGGSSDSSPIAPPCPRRGRGRIQKHTSSCISDSFSRQISTGLAGPGWLIWGCSTFTETSDHADLLNPRPALGVGLEGTTAAVRTSAACRAHVQISSPLTSNPAGAILFSSSWSATAFELASTITSGGTPPSSDSSDRGRSTAVRCHAASA